MKTNKKPKGKKAKRSQFYQWNKNWKKAKRECLDMAYSTKRPYYRVIKNHGWQPIVTQQPTTFSSETPDLYYTDGTLAVGITND